MFTAREQVGSSEKTESRSQENDVSVSHDSTSVITLQAAPLHSPVAGLDPDTEY